MLSEARTGGWIGCHGLTLLSRHCMCFIWQPFSAAHQNDEVLLLIHSEQVAAHFTREMDRLWKGAELGISEQLQRKLNENRRGCGSGIQRT